MMIRHTSPFGELLQLRRAMERMFDEPFLRPTAGSRLSARRLPMDVLETPEALVIEAALPGVKPEDVEVSVLGDVLTLSAGSESETDAQQGWRELRRGKVSRSVTLPQGVVADQASATFENGLLRLSIPKTQPVDRVRIPVTVPVAGEAARIDEGTAQGAEGSSESVQSTAGTDA